MGFFAISEVTYYKITNLQIEVYDMKIKKNNLTIRIPININKKFTKHVSKIGISKNAFILNLINKELNKTKGAIDDEKSHSN